jgi:hypothetical protein
MWALSNVLQSYYSNGKVYVSVYFMLLVPRKHLQFLNHSTDVYFHKRDQLHIDITTWWPNFVMKYNNHLYEIWYCVKWWTFFICMWCTLGIFATQWSLMFLLKFRYQLQDFERERKWKLGWVNYVLAELDFKAHEIQHQKVRLVKLWIVQVWKSFKWRHTGSSLPPSILYLCFARAWMAGTVNQCLISGLDSSAYHSNMEWPTTFLCLTQIQNSSSKFARASIWFVMFVLTWPELTCRLPSKCYCGVFSAIS